MIVILSIAINSVYSSSWYLSKRCAAVYDDSLLSDAEFGYDYNRTQVHFSRCSSAVPDANCNKLLHTCSVSEMKLHKYLGIEQIPAQSLEFDGINPTNTKRVWDEIYVRMANKTLNLIGDSTLYQVRVMLQLYLRSLGYISVNGVYPNGFSLFRPRFVEQIDSDTMKHVLDIVSKSDLVLMNIGVHYGTVSCTNGNKVCHDAEFLMQSIFSHFPDAKVSWMDVLRVHFPAPDGNYLKWKAKHKTASNFTYCATLDGNPNEAYAKGKYDWTLYEPSKIIKEKFPCVSVAELYDLTHDRYDMHQGTLTWLDPTKLDCVHYCMQPCFNEAIAYRIGVSLLQLLNDQLCRISSDVSIEHSVNNRKYVTNVLYDRSHPFELFVGRGGNATVDVMPLGIKNMSRIDYYRSNACRVSNLTFFISMLQVHMPHMAEAYWPALSSFEEAGCSAQYPCNLLFQSVQPCRISNRDWMYYIMKFLPPYVHVINPTLDNVLFSLDFPGTNEEKSNLKLCPSMVFENFSYIGPFREIWFKNPTKCSEFRNSVIKEPVNPTDVLHITILQRDGRRYFVNFNEVVVHTIQQFPRASVTVTSFENKTIPEQIDLLKHTDILIATHGAGLTNVVR